MTSSRTLQAVGPSGHDDYHFLTQAQYLLQGEWLGPYDQVTLIKGPFFPAWIAFMHLLGIPLLISAQVLYALACGLFTRAVRPLLHEAAYTPVLFGILLFNPQSVAGGLTRVIREIITPSLTLLVAGCAVGLMLRHDESGRKSWFWAAALGASFAALWLTREEGIAVVPFIAFSAGAAGWLAWKRSAAPILSIPLRQWILASALWAVCVFSVAALNGVRYGLFAKTEFDAGSYIAAYGALSRVEPAEFKQYVPVTKETRQRIYRVSPAFAELKPFIEGIPGGYWESYSEFQQDDTNRNEILSGWFSWAFRDAVSAAGYYKDGRYPHDFYSRIAREVNAACDGGLLECYPPRSTLIPVWHNAYIRQLIPGLWAKNVETVTFEGITVETSRSIGTPAELALFRELTNNRTSAPANAEQLQLLHSHESALRALRVVYGLLTPVAVLGACLALAMATAKLVGRRPHWALWATLAGLVILVESRIGLVALLDVTSLKVPPGAYMYEAYPPMLAFAVLGSLELIRAAAVKTPTAGSAVSPAP